MKYIVEIQIFLLLVLLLVIYMKQEKAKEPVIVTNVFGTMYYLYDNDERYCKYIATHGIKKSCETIKNVYYVNSNELDNFVVPDSKFVLVTGNSINDVPYHFKEETTVDREDENKIENKKHAEVLRKKSNEILESPKCVAWFSQNLTKTNHKLHHIPIGLDYHTIGTGKEEMRWWGEKETPVKQEEFLHTLERSPFYAREMKIYCNYKSNMTGIYKSKDRKESLEQTRASLLYIEDGKMTRRETWTNMTKYAFVLSPRGDGLDCHRTWEALILGCIPIVKSTPLDELYEGLPVLIVNSWTDINEELLNNTIGEFKNRSFNYKKLELEYYMGKIKEQAKKC